ncbi:MAG: secretin N-terminal domain-containing protein [Pyrinomonadaceae bacterium]
MKKSAYVRFSITLFLLAAMLAPTTILAAAPDGNGKKHFKTGMTAEDAEQWDKAAEEFALAIVDDPKNPEYRLHYQRALFNASQMYMKKGAAQANEKDYAGAYLSFRKAYAYDSTNELARSEMERVLRLQQDLENGDQPQNKTTDASGAVKLVPTGYQKQIPTDSVVPQKLEKLRDVPFPSGVDLQYIIKELAKDLDLNVLFDEQSFRQDRKVKVDLKNVTAARALDYIFLQTNLFFQKVGPRTIIVADQNQRVRFQQLVLRTFYLANAAPDDIAKVIQFAIPPQPGRVQSQPLVDKATNSITVRDTTENIRVIGNLIKSLDKDRAEVVMDVQIYEVNKTDLLKLGNQIGDTSTLSNLGGTNSTFIGNNEFGRGSRTSTSSTAATVASVASGAFGIGFVVPAISLLALQDKQNTKLIASTQIHAFNNEDSSARIGQRVPVRSATISNGFSNGGNNTGGNGNNGGGFLGDVITYEQVGLTLKFKPIVFPNQDVQVAMEIESKDVAGANSLTPTFTERTIKGTARVQNNKTLLLASVAQNSQSNGRTGLPLLGLIPILGRLFTAPTKDNRQVDIVIAVTPRVIRAPAILPEDLIERPTGSLATPTSGSLEAMITQEDIEDNLAAARKIPNVAQVQLPDQKADAALAYVKSTAPPASETKTTDAATTENKTEETNQKTDSIVANLKPIDTSVKTLQITPPTADSSDKTVTVEQTALKTEDVKSNAPVADLQILPTLSEMKAGEKTKIAVMIKSATAFRSAILGLKFDEKKVAIRSVSFGDVFGASLAQTAAAPFFNQGGKMYVSLSSPKDAAENASGVLAYIEIEALADGKPEITFDADISNLLTADGKNFAVKF